MRREPFLGEIACLKYWNSKATASDSLVRNCKTRPQNLQVTVSLPLEAPQASIDGKMSFNKGMRYLPWYHGHGVIGEGNFIHFDAPAWLKTEWKIWRPFSHKTICCHWFTNINYNGYDMLTCYACVYLCSLKRCNSRVTKIMKHAAIFIAPILICPKRLKITSRFYM